MTTPVNYCDLLLQSSVPRLVDPYGVEPLTVSASANTFKFNDNTPSTLQAVNTIFATAVTSRRGTISWVMGPGLSYVLGSGGIVVSAVVDMPGTSWFKAVVTSENGLYDTNTIERTITVIKQLPAEIQVNLTIYTRSTTAPSTPTGGVYNYTSKAFSTLPSSPGVTWSLNTPTGTAPIYSSSTTITLYNPTSTAVNITRPWSPPVQTVKDGESSEGVLMIYTKNASKPATPNPSAGVPAGWYQDTSSLPAVNTTVWVSTGSKAIGATNYIWGSPVQFSAVNSAEITVYIRYPTNPGTPSGGTYNFSTKIVSPPSSWSHTLPEGYDRNPLFMSKTIASSANVSDTVNLSGWSSPIMFVKDGEDGANGTNGTNGLNGVRGSVTVSKAISGTSWSDAEALNAIHSFTGAYTAHAGDMVTLYNTTGNNKFSATKYYSGSSWVVIQNYMDGNLLVKGTITSDAIGTNTLSAVNINTVGTIRATGTYQSQATINGADVLAAGVFQTANTAIAKEVAVGIIGYTPSTVTGNVSAGRWASVGLDVSANKSTGAAGSGGLLGYSIHGWGVFAHSDNSAALVIAGTGKVLWGSKLIDKPPDNTSLFLRGDGTWSAPTGGGTSGGTITITGGSSNWTLSAESNNLVFKYGGVLKMTLDTAGALTAIGNVTANSDSRIKTNIKRVQNPLKKICGISGYHYKNLLAKTNDYGIIAQEVESVLPELIGTNETTEFGSIKTVNYNGIVAVLVEAVKELEAQNKELQRRVEILESVR